MSLGKFGVLLEGYLKQDESGFYIENEGGRQFRLDDILADKEGQEVRFTIATFNDLDALTKKVQEKMKEEMGSGNFKEYELNPSGGADNEDDHSGQQDDQLDLPFEESS